MTKPKIYTVAHPDELSPPLKGAGFCVDVVLASDYAALEQQLAAVTAENTGMNNFIKHSCYVYNGDGSDISDSYIPAHESPMMPVQSQSLLPVSADAALAEIRAKTFDEAASIASRWVGCDEIVVALKRQAQQLRGEDSK